MMTDGVVDRWPLALPTIDIHTIGAGGGSIATVDEGGLLHVGPQSAGAEPGPACYGRGGTAADGHRRRPRPRLPRRGEPARRAACGSTSRPRARAFAPRRATRSGVPSRRRRPASTTSSTSTWRPACATSPCAAGWTRATSRSWWRAAPGRVHAAAIAAELEVALLSSRASRRSSARRACSCATSSTTRCARSSGRSRR